MVQVQWSHLQTHFFNQKIKRKKEKKKKTNEYVGIHFVVSHQRFTLFFSFLFFSFLACVSEVCGYCSWIVPANVDYSIVNSASLNCLQIHKYHFLTISSLKMDPTVLFKHLKVILLKCFQFSVFNFSKISSIQTDPMSFYDSTPLFHAL